MVGGGEVKKEISEKMKSKIRFLATIGKLFVEKISTAGIKKRGLNGGGPMQEVVGRLLRVIRNAAVG